VANPVHIRLKAKQMEVILTDWDTLRPWHVQGNDYHRNRWVHRLSGL